ncbi:hypothetical protein VPH35_119554 [Triticum aestivum]
MSKHCFLDDFLEERLYVIQPEDFSVSDNNVRNIVLSYLMHNCFKETAKTFLSTILNFVVEGDAVKAIELTTELAPNLLENDTDLHFDLISLHFIELIRSRKCTEALEFGQKKLTPFGKVSKYVEKLEPEKSPMFHLLALEYRQNVADSLNRAILAHANLSAYLSLERVIHQSTVVRQYLQQEVDKVI